MAPIAKHVVVTHEVLFLLVHDVVFQFLASPVPVNPASVIPAAQCRGLCLENNILFGLHADGHRMPLAFIDGQQVIYPSLYQRNMHFYDQCAVAPRPDGSLVLCHENALFLLTFSQPAAGAAGSTGVPVVDIRLLFSRASVRLVLFPYFFQSGLMVVTDDTGAVLACGRDDLTCFFESDVSVAPFMAPFRPKQPRPWY
ncbi:hypothetical protein H696_03263 [Fonticula alba]|uniref:CNH domain-containing protein n=1 Tax=Fonticula alba TaxID=691883 RepID=A0A058Z8E4_FONAL|nr:hypothetical protein H696_03263 [Fonticula alba]KCV69807.1 hypothetical protein H696_03263 [Fonticula alba]|eukprot:XP_009495413.1 hypothetical protein H696_03263 [Fonticula alba]